MKTLCLTFIIVLTISSCDLNNKDNINQYYEEFVTATENKKDSLFTINLSTKEIIEFHISDKIIGSYEKNKKNGLWYYYQNMRFNILDSIILYKDNKRIANINIIYEKDYSLLRNGWYLYSSGQPFSKHVPYFEYGFIRNGIKQGEWVEITDWLSFSTIPFTEKRYGYFENGVKQDTWHIIFISKNCEIDGKCQIKKIKYEKTFNYGKLTGFKGYMVEENNTKELKYYFNEDCVFKIENYTEGLKNGKEIYYDCNFVGVFDDIKIMEREYLNDKLHGKTIRYFSGEKIFEAEYNNGVKKGGESKLEDRIE